MAEPDTNSVQSRARAMQPYVLASMLLTVFAGVVSLLPFAHSEGQKTLAAFLQGILLGVAIGLQIASLLLAHFARKAEQKQAREK